MSEETMITGYCMIRGNHARVNDEITFFQENFINFADFIKELYRKEEISYPKFFKMDPLSKLGFMTAEILMKATGKAVTDPGMTGLVLANSSSSLDTDIRHFETIRDRNHYFPSPSVFVYTLPNIMIGEICIRNKFNGENAFLVSEKFDAGLLADYVSELFESHRVDTCLTGWVELLHEGYESLVVRVERKEKLRGGALQGMMPFSRNSLEKLYLNK